MPRDGRRRLFEQLVQAACPQFPVALEPRGRIGDALEQDADEPRAGQHVREAAGRARGVPEHPQEPVRLAQVVAQPPEGQQPVVGVGALGEPLQHDGQQGALDLRAPRDPTRERRDVVQGAARVGEPDGRQPRLGLLAGERVAVLGQRRDGGEQRPVEQPLVQRAHLELGVLPGLDEALGRRGGAGGARQHPQRLVIARHEVRAPHAGQLHAVLQQTQEPVVAGEIGRLDAADVAVVGQSVQGADRRTLAHLGVRLPVHELQQLDRELDVAQAAGTELQLDVDLVRGDVGRHPLAHPLHGVDEALPRGARPDERGHPSHVLVAESAVAGQRTRLQQSLELPALRPALVVRDVGVQAAHERAVLALGPQVRVDLPERWLEGELGDALHGVHREAGGDLDGLLGLGHEDHVDVAEVVQLAGAGLAHADDRQLGRRDVLGRGLVRRSVRVAARRRARRPPGRPGPRRSDRRPPVRWAVRGPRRPAAGVRGGTRRGGRSSPSRRPASRPTSSAVRRTSLR